MRPQRGSRATSTTGASTWLQPRARASLAATVKMRVAMSGSNDEARPIACGNEVASFATKPCRLSSCMNIGMPSRVPSTAHFCMALTRVAASKALRLGTPPESPAPVGAVTPTRSPGRAIMPTPSG